MTHSDTTITRPRSDHHLHVQRSGSLAISGRGGNVLMQEALPEHAQYLVVVETGETAPEIVRRVLALLAARKRRSTYFGVFGSSVKAGTTTAAKARLSAVDKLTLLRSEAAVRHEGLPGRGRNPMGRETRAILEAMIRAQYNRRPTESS